MDDLFTKSSQFSSSGVFEKLSQAFFSFLHFFYVAAIVVDDALASLAFAAGALAWFPH